ncbi:MAG: DUF2834 domain-containing protein [Cyanobacteriota bacterium]|nr:DUF2834 domain-containing protein [Cyanobacteriota bacterium]
MSSPASQPNPDAASAAPGRSPWLQWLYLGLAVAGAVLPWLANVEFIRSTGAAFDLGQFIAMANANPAASSLSRDLAIGATAVVIWMVQESRRLRMRGLPWVLLSCVTLAFACGAPLFLFLRERRLAELERQPGGAATLAAETEA